MESGWPAFAVLIAGIALLFSPGTALLVAALILVDIALAGLIGVGGHRFLSGGSEVQGPRSPRRHS